MYSPDELREKLARQWDNAKLRAERLLPPGNWPLCLAIGKPSAKIFAEQPQRVLQHVQLWRQVAVGRVDWGEVSYRASDGPVSMPLRWILNGPSDWICAAADQAVSREFRLLEGIIEQVDPIFHPLLVSHSSLWRHKSPQDIISAARLACRLEPGCAKGLPLRLLSGQGVDTKFIENNISLLTRLLDVRFSGEASEQGLTTFLDAFDESSHWVLVVPLSPGLLPFKKCRVTTAELAETTLPASRVLVIENEQCLHQLPVLSDTIAILGCGLDVQWLSSSVLDEKRVAYWGDMDSWGLAVIPGLPFSDSVIRIKASLMTARSVSRSVKVLYVRSISTDRRGKSCTNKLIAVPPFRAKQDSFATCGRAAINSLTCRA